VKRKNVFNNHNMKKTKAFINNLKKGEIGVEERVFYYS